MASNLSCQHFISLFEIGSWLVIIISSHTDGRKTLLEACVGGHTLSCDISDGSIKCPFWERSIHDTTSYLAKL